MTDERPENSEAEQETSVPGGGVRRVGRKDQKKRLTNTGPLFSKADLEQQQQTPDAEPTAEPDAPTDPEASSEAEQSGTAPTADEPNMDFMPPDSLVQDINKALDTWDDELSDEEALSDTFIGVIVQDVVNNLPEKVLEDDKADAVEKTKTEAATEAPADEAVIEAPQEQAPPQPEPIPSKPVRPPQRKRTVTAAPPRPNTIYTPAEERFPPIEPERLKVTPDAQPKQAAENRINRAKARRYNRLTAFFLVATVVMLVYLNHLWNNPFSVLSPLPPPTPFVVVTATPLGFVATPPTATPTDDSGITLMTSTPMPDNAAATNPTEEAAPVLLESSAGLPFAMTATRYQENTSAEACNWASIAGQVRNQNGEPLNNFGVEIIDTTAPEAPPVKVFSGSALPVEEGRFQLPLGGVPVEREFTVQLFSIGGAPVSDIYTITTRATCQENITVIDFVQVEDI